MAIVVPACFGRSSLQLAGAEALIAKHYCKSDQDSKKRHTATDRSLTGRKRTDKEDEQGETPIRGRAKAAETYFPQLTRGRAYFLFLIFPVRQDSDLYKSLQLLCNAMCVAFTLGSAIPQLN